MYRSIRAKLLVACAAVTSALVMAPSAHAAAAPTITTGGFSTGFLALAGGCAGADPTVGAALRDARCDDSSTRWSYQPQTDASGGYKVRNVSSGLCLDTSYGSVASGTPLVVGSCAPSNTQQWWTTTPDASGKFQLVQVATYYSPQPQCAQAQGSAKRDASGALAQGEQLAIVLAPCQWGAPSQQFLSLAPRNVTIGLHIGALPSLPSSSYYAAQIVVMGTQAVSHRDWRYDSGPLNVGKNQLDKAVTIAIPPGDYYALLQLIRVDMLNGNTTFTYLGNSVACRPLVSAAETCDTPGGNVRYHFFVQAPTVPTAGTAGDAGGYFGAAGA